MKFLNPRKILFCLRYGIGDLIMELPALDSLRQAKPSVHLTLLGARPAIELLQGDRRPDLLAAIQDFGLTDWGDPGTPEVRRHLAGWLAQEQFDLVLDPSHAARGAGETIWTHSSCLRDAGAALQNEALRGGAGGQAAVLAAVRAGWGLDVPEEFPRLELAEEERRFAAAFRRRRKLAELCIGISPVASSPLKCWPAERFAIVMRRLLADTGGTVLLFCGPQASTSAAILDLLGHPQRVVPVGPLPLRHIAALLGECRIFIGHDTGLMHLAAAVGLPLVALFGPTSPAIYLPLQVPAIALGGRDSCPCRQHFAFGPPRCVAEGRCLAGIRSCIDQVDPTEVLAAVGSLLAAGTCVKGRRRGEAKGWPA